MYTKLDEINVKVEELMEELRELSRTSEIFEQQTPEFKEIVSLRRELRMLKNLWDYSNVISSNLAQWKKTVWKKLDIEGMDVECKKLTRELRRWFIRNLFLFYMLVNIILVCFCLSSFG